MMHVRDAKAREQPAAPLVRAELDRILASDLFVRSDRLSSFLRFIVERTLAGDGESLKEQVIAIELYGKDPNFDAAADPIVRVDARRLRDKLREYYASAGDAAVVISVPKGRYAPAFITAAPDHATSPTTRWNAPLTRRWATGALVVALIAAMIGLTRSRGDDGEALRQIAVTSSPGAEEDPTLSPDGQFVAYSWAESDDAKRDIWIKSVIGEGLVNVTKTPDMSEEFPRWSPNHQWISFSRSSKDGLGVFKISPLGGPADQIEKGASDASWTPDSRALVMGWTTPDRHAGLLYKELESGRRWKLTEAPVGFDDRHPRVSPDGRMVAFIRAGQGRSAIHLVPLAENASPVPVGEWTNGMPAGGLDWTPDGRELVSGKWTGSLRQIVRIPVNPRGSEMTVPGAPSDVAGLSVSRSGPAANAPYRVAVSYGQPKIGLRLVDLSAPRSPAAAAADSPFCDATRTTIPGAFSRDGERVAFVSNRDGSFQVWVANRDGSGARALTHLEGAMVSLGSWSPEGGRLAFDVTIRDHTEIDIVDVVSRTVTQLSDGPANASDPEWSRDGNWIYFSSNQSGSDAIWKMHPDGTSRTKLTSVPGFDPRESRDERTVYFIDQPKGFGINNTATVKRVPVDGGVVEDVGLPVAHGAWSVTDAGIVFAERSDGVQNSRGGRNVLQEYDFADHRIRTIARLGFLIGPYGVPRFLSVSRDGRWALASHIDHWERDVMVLDGLR